MPPTESSDTARAHLTEVLEKAARAWLRLLPQLQECEGDLATLIEKRMCAPWTTVEHAHYLSLRRDQHRLRRRLQRARRVFDRARVRLRDGDALA